LWVTPGVAPGSIPRPTDDSELAPILHQAGDGARWE
jgi:hypothetical protein